ncbi:MAG: hypothetical protein ABIR56_02505 [Polaromonas sp.]
MKYYVIKRAWVGMLMAVALGFGAHAQASSPDAGSKAAATKARKTTGASGQVKFLPGSEETTKERSTRLKRECKGRVNAGACSGYTS